VSDRKKFRTITFTYAQYLVVKRAIEIVRQIENDKGIPKGRALELIAGDFLAGPYRVNAFEDKKEDPWLD